MKYTKTEYFSHWGSNFASVFLSHQAQQNAVNRDFFLIKFIFFLELIKFYVFELKITVL